MKRIKKILAFLLVVAITASGISLGGLNTSAQKEELVTNGSFDAKMQGWVVNKFNDSNGTITIETEQAHDGAYAMLKTDAVFALETSAEYLIPVQPNTIYQYSFYVKLTGTGAYLMPYIYYYDKDGSMTEQAFSALDGEIEEETGWKKVKGTTTIPNEVYQVGLSFVLGTTEEDGVDVFAGIDDVTLNATEETKSVLDMYTLSEEDTSTAYEEEEVRLYATMRSTTPTSLLDCDFDTDTIPFILNAQAVLTTKEKVSGTQSLQLTTDENDSHGYAQGSRFTVEGGKTYTIKGKIKAEKNTVLGALIYVFDANGAFTGDKGTLFQYRGEADEAAWQDFSFDYTTSDEAVSFRLDFQHRAGQNKNIYLDDITVIEKTEVGGTVEDADNLLTNGYFEKGNMGWDVIDKEGTGSTHAIIDSGEADHGRVMQGVVTRADGQVYMYSGQISVKPNYVYTVSYDIKVTPNSKEDLPAYGARATIMEKNTEGQYTGYGQTSTQRNQTKGWETVTFEYATSADVDTLRLDLMFANIPGTVLWDNVVIKEKGKYTPTVLEKKYDHGGTDDTKSTGNVIANSTFDNGVATGWNTNDNIKTYQTANAGGGVMKIAVKPNVYTQTSSGMTVQGESIYNLTYYVKVEEAKNLDFFSFLFYMDGEGKVSNWKDFLSYRVTENTKGAWKKVSIDFATPKLTDGQLLTIGFKAFHPQSCAYHKGNVCDCDSKGTIYLDDISLIRKGDFVDVGEGRTSEDSVVYNGTFDRYASNDTTVDGWNLNPSNTNFKATVQSEVAKKGNAIKFDAKGHSFIWAQDFSVIPGRIYILSYWVRVDSAKGLKFAPYMNDANYGKSWWLDDAATPVTGKTNGWVKISSAVSIPKSVGTNEKNPNCMVQLGFQIYEGSGIIYLDEVSMVATDIKVTDKNLDFELDKNYLYNWSTASYNGTKATATTTTETRPGSKGKTAALVVSEGAEGNSVLASTLQKVEPNTTYEFSYWTKQDSTFDARTVHMFRQYQEDGKTAATSPTWDSNKTAVAESEMISPFWTYQVQGNVGWRQVRFSITTGENTHYLQIRFSIRGTLSKVYIDDVKLKKVSKTANLDFESTSKFSEAPENWYASMARSQTIEFKSDSSLYHSGGKSLYIKKDSFLEKTLIDSAAFIPVEKDMIYEFSFWVNSRNVSPDCTIRMNLQVYNEDGTRIYMKDGNYETVYGTVSALNSGTELSGWKKVITRSAVPAEAAYATISFTISRGYAEIWIDDIFFDVVEDETDCVVYYSDFHAVDQDGNLGEWELEQVSGTSGLAKVAGGAKLNIKSGESYMKTRLTCFATDYAYCIKGNYTATRNMELQIRYYDYMRREYEEERVTTTLMKNQTSFEVNLIAPSASYVDIYIGGQKAGNITMKNITVYMTAKSASSADWDGEWVWYPEDPVKEAVEQYRYFRYEFVLEDDAEYAPLQLTADDKFAFYLNGELIAENWDEGSDSWGNVKSYDLTDKVKKGRNIMAFKCYNLVSEAALLFDGKFTLENQSTVVIASCSDVVSSKTANDKTLDWIQLNYDDSNWRYSTVYGQPPCSPWGPVFYDTSLYIENAAEVIGTEVPEKVTSGKNLEFTLTLKLDSPIESKFTPLVTIYKRNSLTSVTSTPMTLLTRENPLEWPVGEEFEVECSVTIPDYVESGQYQLQMDENTLLLSGENVYDNKFVSFKAVASATGREPIESKIETVNGTPTLTINGEPQATHLYLRPDMEVYLQTDAETRMYKSDIELYVTYGGSLYRGGTPSVWIEEGKIDYDAFDSVIYDTLGSNSNALAMVNIGMFAPPWWLEQNPDHEVLSDSGDGYVHIGEVSHASEKFRQEAGEVLRLLIRHMKEQSYYNRIYGLKISGGQSYEWMTRGTSSTQGPDYSKVSQEGFKKFLKEKYETVAALREAWGDSKVTFETAKIPSWTERSDSDNIFIGSITDNEFRRDIIDWNLWTNECSADSFLYYCQIAKEETDYQLIVGGYNGYLWTSNSYDAQGTAHTAFSRVLNSEYVDWVASPIAYSERLIGESSHYMTLIDTVQEYGKMYIAEQDNRTCLTDTYAGASWDTSWDFSVGQTRTLSETVAQQKRDFANAMINGVGLWQYDMYGGWLDDDQIYDYFSDAKAEYDFSVYVDRDQRNDVAVFVGDETYTYMTTGQMIGYTLFEPMLAEQRKHLIAMGAGYDTYTMSSLLDGKVSPHKLNIILSPFEITAEMQNAIDKYLKVNDQYVVWVYLPGISTGTEYSLANVKETTGFEITVEEKKTGLRVELVDSGHPITEGIAGVEYGGSSADGSSPLVSITETADMTVLGYNVDGGNVGLALKEMDDWTSIYSTAQCLDVNLLRNLLTVSGCHIYSQSNEDVIYNNNHYVALHSKTGGEKTITLPENYSVYDVFEGEFVSMDTKEFTYYSEDNDTHIFRLLTPNTYAVTARLKSGKGTLSAPGLTEVEVGGNYELTVEPEEGYEVAEVLVNDAVVELTDNTFRVENMDQNYVIEVKFTKLPTLVEVVDYIEEIVYVNGWLLLLGVAVFTGLLVVLVRLIKDAWRKKKEKEEGGAVA